ncbi:MAG: hypothetical protein NTW35_02650 [Candidatus Nomurabacteria bacterium]|nr:hypothetical protein [Candidatus Nomurabacteria bacterium]
MEQKNKIMPLIIILIIIGGIVFWYMTKNKDYVVDSLPVATNSSTTNNTKEDIAQKAASTIPKTNPFESKVSPYDAYKNPFGN